MAVNKITNKSVVNRELVNRANEVSFITSFQVKTQLLELREALYKLDDQLEVTFLDNTKIF